jgi:hypothetical protein
MFETDFTGAKRPVTCAVAFEELEILLGLKKECFNDILCLE